MNEPRVPPADAALREALIQALGDVVYDWRPLDDRLEWAGAFTRILGYSSAEMGADTASWTSRVHPDDLPAVLNEVEKARVERRAYDLEYRFRHRDGHYLWMQDRGVLFLDAARQVERIVGVFRDVTGRKRAEEELRASREHIERLSRMRGIMGSINALIVRTRSRTELFQEACRIAVEQGGFGLAWIGLVREGNELAPVAHFGNDGGQLERLRLPLSADDHTAGYRTVLAVRQGLAQVCNDVAADRALGPWREVMLGLGHRSFVSCPLMVGGQVHGCLNFYAGEPGAFDEDELKLLAGLAHDIGYALDFILKDETLDFLSIYDPLTRLPNRSLFLRRLADFIAAARESARRLAVLMLDLEHFKAINDAVGHAGGDALLKLVGERLKFHAGGPSYMARIAGDRFAVVLTDLDKDEDVEARVAAGDWDRLDPPFEYGGHEFAVTLRLGVAVYPQDGADAEALLRNAELAVKHGKTSARSVTRYTASMSAVATRKLNLERELRRALERSEFRLEYQPRVDLGDGRICGAEALLRWRNADGVAVPPGEIVPLMEESGLIVEVGAWALGQALRDRARWRADGLAAPRVAVNVSPVQLRDESFPVAVAAALAATGDAGSALELEITESLVMGERDGGAARLRALRDQGVAIAIDDFGTGYSSLAHLARLPLQAVKIDRSFIATLGADAATTSIVSAIIALAHSMSLRVIAEGVETPEQVRFLRQHRCDEIQGWAFSRALPAAEFAELLRAGRTLGA
jgi:diguanylate cyclase (GGDEF)-like protein/PAS domain S-box-containing protein